MPIRDFTRTLMALHDEITIYYKAAGSLREAHGEIEMITPSILRIYDLDRRRSIYVRRSEYLSCKPEKAEAWNEFSEESIN